MKLRDALTKSIRAYYDGKLPDSAIAASDKDFRYTLKYFDKVDEDNKPVKAGEFDAKAKG